MERDNPTSNELKQQVQQLVAQQRFQEAQVLCARLVELEPDNDEHRLRFGTVLAMGGDFEGAARHYQEAIDLNPSLAAGYYSLANVQKKSGALTAAIANLKKAVELEPEWAQALNNLAGTLLYAGRSGEAVACYQRLATLIPADPEVSLQLARAYGEDGRVDEAVALYWQILRSSPANGTALAALGELLYNSHRYPELLEYCQHVKQQFPGDPKPYAIEAKVLGRQGAWQRARQILDGQLEQHPPDYDLVTAYAQIARQAEADERAIELIEALLRNDKLLPPQQAELHFSLGRLYDHEHDYDRAFANFQQANRLRYQGVDLAGQQRLVADITGHLDSAFFESHRRTTATPARPLFIVGMPRSGTSLIEQVLDSHSQIFGGGELYYINDIARQIEPLEGSYGEAVAQLGEDELARHAQYYLDRIEQLDGTARYVSDKMPQNFLHLGLIARLFPGARIIHCVRDPVDVCLSCYFQSFNRGHEYAYDLEALAGYYRSYHELMQHWQKVLDLPWFTLRYETLVDQPEETVSALLNFLELPWEEQCLRHHENRRLTLTSSHDQVRQPLYRRSLQRWRHYERHIGVLLSALGDLRDAYEESP